MIRPAKKGQVRSTFVLRALRAIARDPNAKPSEKLEACKLVIELEREQRQRQAQIDSKPIKLKDLQSSPQFTDYLSMSGLISRNDSQQTAQNG